MSTYTGVRDLYPFLGYDTWRRFETAIERAKGACANLGEDTTNHFAGAVKVNPGGYHHQRRRTDGASGDSKRSEFAAPCLDVRNRHAAPDAH